MPEGLAPTQLLHPVFGGGLDRLDDVALRDPDRLDIVGMLPNYATACAVRKAKAQQTVDTTHMRHSTVHLHRMLDPGTSEMRKPATGRTEPA